MHALHFIMFLSPADVVKNSYRKKQQTGSQCSTHTHYIFQWKPLSEALSVRPLSLDSIYIRVYLQLDQKNVDIGEKFTLEVTVDLRNASKLYTNANSARASLTHELTLSEVSDQWIEVNLTDAVKQLWPQKVKNSTEMAVSIRATGSCMNEVSIPITFVNPAEIPPNTELRNSSVASAQPLLLVFATDDTLSQRHQRSHNVKPHPPNQADRHTRSADNECQRHNHSVTFGEIGLTNVAFPHSLNIGKCSGSCSDQDLREHSSLGTNHARVMSSVRSIQDSSPALGQAVTSDGPASVPCCVPSVFDPQTPLYMADGDGDSSFFSLHRSFFDDLVIQSCGCH